MLPDEVFSGGLNLFLSNKPIHYEDTCAVAKTCALAKHFRTISFAQPRHVFVMG